MTLPAEAWGWLASACVLLAFLMRRMRPLRLAAIASNLAFLVYAAEFALMPVLLLHAVLLPGNLWRLWEGEAPAGPVEARDQRRVARWPFTPRLPAFCLVAGLAALVTALSLRCAPASEGQSLAAAREVRIVAVGPVLGSLTLPAADPPVGLVLLLPDSLGHDPRSARYVEQLLRAGLAAFDVERGEADAKAIAAALPAVQDAAGTQGRPVGVIGFGAGARAALRLAPPVAVRVLLYPGCAGLAPPSHRAATLLVHGEADPANPRPTCAAVAARLGGGGPVVHLAYPAAGYAWDYPAYGQDRRIRLPRPDGQGTAVSEPWPELAAMAASQAADFIARVAMGGAR